MIPRGRDSYGPKTVMERSFLFGRPHDIDKNTQVRRMLTIAQERHINRGRRERCRYPLSVTPASHDSTAVLSSNSRVAARILDHNAVLDTLQSLTMKATTVESITKTGHECRHYHSRSRVNGRQKIKTSYHGSLTPIADRPIIEGAAKSIVGRVSKYVFKSSPPL